MPLPTALPPPHFMIIRRSRFHLYIQSLWFHPVCGVIMFVQNFPLSLFHWKYSVVIPVLCDLPPHYPNKCQCAINYRLCKIIYGVCVCVCINCVHCAVLDCDVCSIRPLCERSLHGFTLRPHLLFSLEHISINVPLWADGWMVEKLCKQQYYNNDLSLVCYWCSRNQSEFVFPID